MPSADFLGKAEPVFTFQYLCTFTAIANLTPLYVAKVNVPDGTWEEVSSGYFVSSRKFASKFKLDNCTLDIKDFVDVDSAAAIYAWSQRVGDPIAGTLNPPSQYKSSGVLIVTDGRGSALNTWTMGGCWPSKCTFGNFESDTGTIIQINITVAVDTLVMG